MKVVKNEVLLVYSTFADRADAERVARAVLDEKLAACVNILAPCASIYRWQGEIAQGEEVPALFKTRLVLERRLRERIAELHAYDVPVIESWSVSANDAAFDWIANETL
jgi:periplasmic divalent cation tolerance protein